ncbi:MAG: hypothetical protein ACAH80_02000 [Alphaproteobacteria bacterium]
MAFDAKLLCPLCGERQSQHTGYRYISREHIPPQSIFVDKTDDLITVPSCKECNHGTKDFDEKFKAILGLYFGYERPALWNSVRGTVRKNQKMGRSFLENTSVHLAPYGQGEMGHPAKIEAVPVNIVVKKIVRGLHWHVTKNVLPPTAQITVVLVEQRNELSPDVKAIFERFGRWLESGGGCFQAQYAIVEDQSSSIWRLRFYDEDFCTAYVEPPEG